MKVLTRHGSKALGVALVALTSMACGGASASSTEPAAPSSSSSSSSTPIDTASATSAEAMDAKSLCAKATPIGKATSARSLDSETRTKEPSLALASLAASGALQAKATAYSLADLQALAARQAWEELLGHAEDVAPAQRTAVWDDLVESAATGYVSNLGTQADAYDAVFASQALLRRFPRLSSSSGFMSKRGEAGKAAAARCLERASVGQHCIDGLAVEMACGLVDELNARTRFAGLPIPAAGNAAGARHIAVGGCWEKLHPAIAQGLQDPSAGSYYRDNACAVLEQKGALR